MIVIPFEVVFGSAREIGALYYYSSDHLIGTVEPHYFAVLAITASSLYVVCATSKINKQKEWATRNSISLKTLVEVEPTTANGLTMKSLFDCNSVYEETFESLKMKHADRQIRVKGKLSNDTIILLQNGIKISPLVTTETKKLIT